MPTYDYRCKSCDHEFEVMQSMTARRLRKCPECGQKALERLIGAGAGVLFKGSGFYQTDYARPSGGGCSGGSKPAEPEPKAETKPEAGPSSD